MLFLCPSRVRGSASNATQYTHTCYPSIFDSCELSINDRNLIPTVWIPRNDPSKAFGYDFCWNLTKDGLLVEENKANGNSE